MVVKLRSKLVRNKEGTEHKNEWDMKNIFCKVVFNSRAYFGSLGPRKQNEHVLIVPSKEKNLRINN